MANTGNTQQIINYGATANDGTGDPLRTAFIKTDENFDNVWLAGPVGSNVTISNNTIQTNNTNGNITIKPNGTGVIQANASILPNSAGTRDLGSSALSWRRAYVDELLPESLTVSGDATIGGNLTVQGDTIQIGNITTDTLTIQLANTASNKTAANGAGITVGANDAIATFLFNSTSNTWVTNIGANVSGNITAGYFIGNGSLLTGITGSYSNANVANYLPTYSGNISAGNISVTDTVNITKDLYAKTGTFIGDATGDGAMYVGYPTFTNLGSDVVAQFSGNTDAYIQFNFQNGNSGTLASGDYVITANNGDDATFFFNMGLGSNNHSDPDFFGDSSTPNDAYIYVVGNDATGPGDTGPGNLIIGSTNGSIKMFVGNTAQANVVQTLTRSGVTVTGNITANYFSGNGSLLTGISASTGNFVFANNQMSIANTVMEISATGAGADVDIEAADAVFIEALAGEVDIRSADDTFITTGSGGNIWTFGIDGTLTAPGNISAGNINVSDTVNITQDLFVKTGTFTGDATGDNSIYAGFPTFTNLGSDVVAQFSGNTDAYIQFNFQNGNTGTQASGDYVITADNGNDTTHFLNIGLTGSNWNGTQPNSLSSRLLPNDGYMYVQDGNLAIGVKDGNTTGWIWRFDITGSVTADGNLIPSANGNYSLGNSTNYWANVWLGNITTSNISVSGNITGGNISTGVITLTNGATIRDTSGDAVAFGQNAGLTSQGNFAVGIGRNAGQTTQGGAAVAIGVSAGDTSQGNSAVAVGQSAGFTNQSANTVAVGVGAGQTSQGVNAVAVGASAGSLTQGIAAVAIGTLAGRTFQANNSIIINATGANLDQTTANTFTVAPVRNDVANVAEILFYNTTSKEITYGNVISVAGNISGNYILGNGSQLTNLPAPTVTQDISSTGAMSIMTYDGTIKYVNYATVEPASGNITGGNILTGGLISATGNVTGGNIITTGNITGNTAGFAIGYRDIPQVSFTGNATIATADAGKHFYSTQSIDYILTIANNASQGFQTGAAITVINQGTGNITLAQGSGVTLYLTGNATSGNRTVTTFGMATLIKVATDTWFVSGSGVI